MTRNCWLSVLEKQITNKIIVWVGLWGFRLFACLYIGNHQFMQIKGIDENNLVICLSSFLAILKASKYIRGLRVILGILSIIFRL